MLTMVDITKRKKTEKSLTRKFGYQTGTVLVVYLTQVLLEIREMVILLIKL